jgi:O-antigen/teichoic acid export membrane protein
LGVDSFGILSLAWMLLGSFTLFDLGLGRATTKFIAEEMPNGQTERLRALFWTSCAMNLTLGVAGGLAVAGLASVLAENVFRLPPELVETARTTFLILAVATPIVLVSTAFRGALEAAQRFDYVNSISVASSSLTYLLPLLGVLTGLGVCGIILLLVCARLGGALAYLLSCFKVFPILRRGVFFDLKRVRRLLTFGGWVSVSNLLNPVFVYLDRFLIGSVISIAAVAYYTAPYEMIMRLCILPASMTMTLFPAFSAMGASSKEELTTLYARSVKYLLLLMGLIVTLLILFAGDILRLWLGAVFAEKSTTVIQILAVGIFFNSLAYIPYALLQGIGRPDITAKFHLLELIVYVPLMWLLVTHAGIPGAALAWSVRVLLDSILLFTASGRFTSFRVYLEKGMKRGISVVALTAVLLVASAFLQPTLLLKAAIGATIAMLFALSAWRYVLDANERKQLVSTARQFASGPTVHQPDHDTMRG